MIAAIVSAALLASTASAAVTSPVWAAGAASTDKSTTITVQAKLDAGQWVGIGFPDPADGGMAGADLVLLWPNSTGSGVQLLHATGGKTQDGLVDIAATDVEIALVVSNSSYANGVLTAVFTRDLKGSTNGIVVAPTNATNSYLWAIGKVGTSGPIQHDKKGSVSGALEGALAAAAPSGNVSASPSSSAAATTSSAVASVSKTAAASTTSSKPNSSGGFKTGAGLLLAGIASFLLL